MPPFLTGVISATLLVTNTVFWCIPFYVFGIVKLAVPTVTGKDKLDAILRWFAEAWITCNSFALRTMHATQWEVRGVEDLQRHQWYLVTSNHQTWGDVPVMQYALNRRVPFLKVFLKQELIWVPLLGLTWWFLDFPFMKRFSRAYLEKHPEMRGKDVETTRAVCEKYRRFPTSIMSFAEGTRFTAERHAQQQSPYAHMLRPKAGGLAFALGSMGTTIQRMIDVTIVYLDEAPDFWGFLCGRARKIVIEVRELEIPPAMLEGDYETDDEFRKKFQAWITGIWEEKDTVIERILAEG